MPNNEIEESLPMILWLRSLAFNLAFYGWTALVCLSGFWVPLLLPPRQVLGYARWYFGTLAWLERHLIGLDYRVIGREHLPPGACIVAAKHQSAWETLKLYLLFDFPAVVLKRELMGIPIWGWFAAKLGVIPVDRGAGTKALRVMLGGARAAMADGRPLVIFPQGTRTAPGTRHPYRVGVGVIYQELGVPMVPLALNSGLFWPRRRFIKHPGTITLEFLPPIPPGLKLREVMTRLEQQLESASDRLAAPDTLPSAQG